MGYFQNNAIAGVPRLGLTISIIFSDAHPIFCIIN